MVPGEISKHTIVILLVAVLVSALPGYATGQCTNGLGPPRLDTLVSFLHGRDMPPLIHKRLKHQDDHTWHKVGRANRDVAVYNITMGAYLLIAPDYITNWHKQDKFQMPTIRRQFENSFTMPPVIDNDLFMVNYIGHTYQGGYYYNAVRAQGGSAWHAALFCTVQSVLWEYVWEGGMEQPSIQDLLTTPIGGILYGELTHILTLKMGRNGYSWIEAVIVRLMNPAYSFNNKLRVWKFRPQCL